MEEIKTITITTEELKELFRDVIRETNIEKFDLEQKDKLISPEQVCHLFSPRISFPTLARYEKNGLVIKYRIGARTWYKYGEIMKAIKKIRKYSHTNHLQISDKAA